jgi:hypothetical protein
MRRWKWVIRMRRLLSYDDYGSLILICFMVYAANRLGFDHHTKDWKRKERAARGDVLAHHRQKWETRRKQRRNVFTLTVRINCGTSRRYWYIKQIQSSQSGLLRYCTGYCHSRHCIGECGEHGIVDFSCDSPRTA